MVKSSTKCSYVHICGDFTCHKREYITYYRNINVRLGYLGIYNHNVTGQMFFSSVMVVVVVVVVCHHRATLKSATQIYLYGNTSCLPSARCNRTFVKTHKAFEDTTARHDALPEHNVSLRCKEMSSECWSPGAESENAKMQPMWRHSTGRHYNAVVTIAQMLVSPSPFWPPK